MFYRINLFILFLLFIPVLAHSATTGSGGDFKAALLTQEAILQKSNSLSLQDKKLYAADYAFKLYRLASYQPLWNHENATALIESIENIRHDGLSPKDYLHDELLSSIITLKDNALPVTARVDNDLLFTEAFLRATYNLLVGKVDPESLDSDFNFSQQLGNGENLPMLLQKIQSGQIDQALDWARPQHRRYQWLKDALAKYRAIQQAGGWQPIADGKSLKPGDSDPRVIQLRKRLQVTGDYQASMNDSPLFDEDLVRAVEHFQSRHGLEVDGAVGKQTLAALNTPVEKRIEQIRVALERQRWYLHEAKGEYIVVDIAGFKAYWVKDNNITWQEIVQVGKAYTNTPVFKDRIRYLEFNPTWTIPPGIKRRSILPKLKKDPEYLEKKGYLLLSQDGTPIDASTIDWSSISNMPYIVRQPPGKDNALGLVKFMFPNKHAVYLHDTNNRELFNRTQRTFSSGCVRVNNPFDLAERLLEGQDDWNREKIDQVLASGKTTRVNLDKPMRIIIAYNTVNANRERVEFKPDIYQRDPAVLKGLNGQFRLRKQDR
jgi:murein L,D-transpeptidase YcbB/YkuD